jgi:hypothetical protein
MEETKKIILTNIKISSTPKSSFLPPDYIEIISKYIGVYHGCWIRYTSKETMENFPGGFLTEVTEDHTVILRNIKRETFEKNIDDFYFYCKSDVPNHSAVKSIVQEHEKLSIKIAEFNIEKRKFIEKMKKSFSKTNVNDMQE